RSCTSTGRSKPAGRAPSSLRTASGPPIPASTSTAPAAPLPATGLAGASGSSSTSERWLKSGSGGGVAADCDAAGATGASSASDQADGIGGGGTAAATAAATDATGGGAKSSPRSGCTCSPNPAGAAWASKRAGGGGAGGAAGAGVGTGCGAGFGAWARAASSWPTRKSRSFSRPGGSTSSWPCSLADRWRIQRCASQPSRRAARSASSKITSRPGASSTGSSTTSASSIAGSSATSTAWAPAPARVATSSSAGSASSTTLPPAASSAWRSRSRAWPSRARSATALEESFAGTGNPQQVVHVSHQVEFLVRLAQVTLGADFEGALAMLFAGTRGDHHDRHVAEARVGAHRGGQLVAVHARHLDVQQHQVGHALFQPFQRLDAVARGYHLEVVASHDATGDLADGPRA